jgi:hypothetical protein
MTERQCDLCPTVKAAADLWFHVAVTAETITVSTWDRSWRGKGVQNLDLCGDACVSKAVQTFLAKRAQGKRRTPPAIDSRNSAASGAMAA